MRPVARPIIKPIKRPTMRRIVLTAGSVSHEITTPRYTSTKCDMAQSPFPGLSEIICFSVTLFTADLSLCIWRVRLASKRQYKAQILAAKRELPHNREQKLRSTGGCAAAQTVHGLWERNHE